MNRTVERTDSITYDLGCKQRYAVTTILIGLLVGGGTALAGGGSLAQQLVLATLITTVVSGSSYWVLSRLAASVTGGTGYYRIENPRRNAGRIESERELVDEETDGEPTLVESR